MIGCDSSHNFVLTLFLILRVKGPENNGGISFLINSMDNLTSIGVVYSMTVLIFKK